MIRSSLLAAIVFAAQPVLADTGITFTCDTLRSSFCDDAGCKSVIQPLLPARHSFSVTKIVGATIDSCPGGRCFGPEKVVFKEIADRWTFEYSTAGVDEKYVISPRNRHFNYSSTREDGVVVWTGTCSNFAKY